MFQLGLDINKLGLTIEMISMYGLPIRYLPMSVQYQ